MDARFPETARANDRWIDIHIDCPFFFARTTVVKCRNNTAYVTTCCIIFCNTRVSFRRLLWTRAANDYARVRFNLCRIQPPKTIPTRNPPVNDRTHTATYLYIFRSHHPHTTEIVANINVLASMYARFHCTQYIYKRGERFRDSR